jgi:hypothetical protein
MFNSETLEKKWAPVLEAQDAPKFKDNYRKSITAVLLENQEKALSEERSHASFITEGNAIGNIAAPSQNGGAIQTWDPVLISLVRRAMPNIVAYDIAGVQPMTMPTGLIFAMKSNYQVAGANAGEALFEKPTAFSGPVNTAAGEALDGDSVATAVTGANPLPAGRTIAGGGFGNMGFTVDKTTVTAKTRALKAEYTMELAQDLKAVHGLDAEAELANILSVEILAEINREVIDTINDKAIAGVNGTGAYDLDQDADGRWAVEKFKSLLFQIEVEANEVAKATRRGKGNFIVCSSNVASALAAAGVLDYAPALATNLNVDDTGNVFAGMINGRLKVFIDPFSSEDYVTVGYRGTNAYDAGMFYCPYVPLTMVRAVDPGTFQPKIGFKTRYGLVANPFAGGASASETGTNGQNPYFRTFTVAGVNGSVY